MNPLVSNQQQTQQMPNIGEMYQNFTKNPIEYLVKCKYSIPQNVGTDPQSIIQHLLNSGQLTQQQLNQAQNMMPRFKQMFGGR